MADRLDLGGLQVEQYIRKNYTSQVNLALSRYFSVFSVRIWRVECELIFHFPSCMHVSAAARFYKFHFKFTFNL